MLKYDTSTLDSGKRLQPVARFAGEVFHNSSVDGVALIQGSLIATKGACDGKIVIWDPEKSSEESRHTICELEYFETNQYFIKFGVSPPTQSMCTQHPLSLLFSFDLSWITDCLVFILSERKLLVAAGPTGEIDVFDLTSNLPKSKAPQKKRAALKPVAVLLFFVCCCRRFHFISFFLSFPATSTATLHGDHSPSGHQ